MLNAASNRIVRFLWWSSFRRPFEAVVRRGLRNTRVIQTGALRGCHFEGGLAQLLGIYEPVIQKSLQAHLKPGAVFYDIGANNGFFTLLASKLVGPDGLVFAFEPLPGNLKKLEEHLALNRVSNCILLGKAVSDRIGLRKLFLSESNATASLLAPLNPAENSITVETVSLDDFVRANPVPALIKVDVEGAETEVLEGASALLSGPGAPALIVEIHDPENGEQVQRLLERAGYRLVRLPEVRKNRPPFPAHWFASRYREPSPCPPLA